MRKMPAVAAVDAPAAPAAQPAAGASVPAAQPATRERGRKLVVANEASEERREEEGESAASARTTAAAEKLWVGLKSRTRSVPSMPQGRNTDAAARARRHKQPFTGSRRRSAGTKGANLAG